MTANDLRKKLPLKLLSSLADGHAPEPLFRAMLDGLGEEEGFALTRDQRDLVARRAARLYRGRRLLRAADALALARGSWVKRAEAAKRILQDAPALAAAGSLAADAGGGKGGRQDRLDALEGHAAAQALLVAAHEVSTPGMTEALRRLGDEGRVALRHEADGDAVWKKAERPLLATFARNARFGGHDRASSALAAMTAAALLKGRALDRGGDATVQKLGSAARILVKRPRIKTSPATKGVARLAKEMAATNAVRLSLWEPASREEARVMGAAAACAVFGKGALHHAHVPHARPSVEGDVLTVPHLAARVRFPDAWSRRFTSMTAVEAAQELEAMAARPHADEASIVAADLAAEAVKAHPDAEHVTFASALGLETPLSDESVLRYGRVWRVAHAGHRRPLVLFRGKRGRLLRARPIADGRGALVGYVAFDPLSREIGGRPLYAAYALDGSRRGYAWADEPLHIRLGTPKQGFMSAPEAISL